jgi:pSer/pThr/pTyr-binding forkhead associated (FHA) protein
MAKNVVVLKNFEVPKHEGVHVRLICLTGSNKGQAYLLSGLRIVIGRGDNVDIKLDDIKSSREHAEITKVGASYILSDLKSQNGTVLNEDKVTQKELKDGDKIIIGQTVLKFSKVEVKPTRTKNNEDNVIDFQSPSFEDEAPKSKLSSILVVVIIAAIGLMLFDTSGDKKEIAQKAKQKVKTEDVSDDFMNALKAKQANENKEQKQKINTILQKGLREYREKNYFRAINEFNLALILNPGDPVADFYLRRTKEELDKVIEELFIKAKRDEESLRYQNSIVTLCSIIRYLFNYPEDQRYKSAEEQIKNIEGLLGLEPGETSCIKKQRVD